MRCNRLLFWTAVLLPSLMVCPEVVRGEIPKFEPVVIDPNVGKVCYAVLSADVNHDGKPDIVAVSEDRVQWYRNPDWKKQVIIEKQVELDHVCLAAHDIDGDGQLDFALGAGWTKIGTMQWITRTADPEALWQVHFIGKELSTHRMSFADVLGTGKKQLVVSPLNKSIGEGARLLAFEIPANPKTDRWSPTVLEGSLNRIHNHTHLDFLGNGQLETLAASEEGVFRVHRTSSKEFAKQQLGSGASSDQPVNRGAGEIRVGKFGQQRILATVEPMHGNMAVVYFPPEKPGDLWKRHVLDDSLKQGHAVWVSDLNRDGRDEIIIGHREPGTGAVKGPGVYVFQADDAGKTWTKHVLDDGGVAVEDAFAFDADGDGWPDIVAGGRATHNIKLYRNLGAAVK